MKFLIPLSLVFLTNFAFADAARDQDMFGEAPAAKKEESSIKETTTIGGRISVDSAGVLREGDVVGNALWEYDTTLYTYLDARPNEETRAFVRLRAIHPDPNVKPALAEGAGPRFDLDETWVKIAAWDKRAYITLGRQHVKWGTGRFWNPSDVLAPSAKDPFAVFDYRLGTNLLKLHYPWEKEGANFYAIVDVDHLNSYKKPGGAVRAEFLVHQAEISFTAYHRDHKTTMLATDVSMGAGPVDLRGEFAISTNNPMTFYKGPGLSNPLATESISRKKEWIPQLVTGVKYPFQYAEQKHLDVEFEYFYNGMGYDKEGLELLALISGQSAPLYAGRQYAGLLFGLPTPGKLQDTSFYLSGLYNISDRSGLSRFSMQTRFFKEALLEFWASATLGDTGEFRFKVPAGTAVPSQAPGGETVSTTLLASGISRALGASVSMSF